MKLTRNVIICLGALTLSLIVGGCVAITLLTQEKETAEWLDSDIGGEEFMTFYTQNKKPTDRFDVTKVLMREDGNFMQGFYYDADENQFVESSGIYGKSRVQWLQESLDDPYVLEPDFDTKQTFSMEYFGEGISPRNANEFLFLTWQQRTVFRLNRNDLEISDETFTLPKQIKEGWGITADERESEQSASGNYPLYVSDGTDKIFQMNGDDFTIDKTITVLNNGKNQEKINELEFAHGSIYANVWYEDVILKINKNSGEVEDSWDISSLADAERAFQIDQKGGSNQDCLNGIAYDKVNDKFYLSGKNHHLIFEVELFPSS